MMTINNTKSRTKRPRRDQELTETEAEEYARDRHGFNLTIGRLQQSHVGKCTGPKYIKKDGFHVRYTRSFIDEHVEANKPRVIDPSERMAAVS